MSDSEREPFQLINWAAHDMVWKYTREHPGEGEALSEVGTLEKLKERQQHLIKEANELFKEGGDLHKALRRMVQPGLRSPMDLIGELKSELPTKIERQGEVVHEDVQFDGLRREMCKNVGWFKYGSLADKNRKFFKDFIIEKCQAWRECANATKNPPSGATDDEKQELKETERERFFDLEMGCLPMTETLEISYLWDVDEGHLRDRNERNLLSEDGVAPASVCKVMFDLKERTRDFAVKAKTLGWYQIYLRLQQHASPHASTDIQLKNLMHEYMEFVQEAEELTASLWEKTKALPEYLKHEVTSEMGNNPFGVGLVWAVPTEKTLNKFQLLLKREVVEEMLNLVSRKLDYGLSDSVRDAQTVYNRAVDRASELKNTGPNAYKKELDDLYGELNSFVQNKRAIGAEDSETFQNFKDIEVIVTCAQRIIDRIKNKFSGRRGEEALKEALLEWMDKKEKDSDERDWAGHRWLMRAYELLSEWQEAGGEAVNLDTAQDIARKIERHWGAKFVVKLGNASTSSGKRSAPPKKGLFLTTVGADQSKFGNTYARQFLHVKIVPGIVYRPLTEIGVKDSAPKKGAPKEDAPKKSAPKKSAPKKSAPKEEEPIELEKEWPENAEKGKPGRKDVRLFHVYHDLYHNRYFAEEMWLGKLPVADYREFYKSLVEKHPDNYHSEEERDSTLSALVLDSGGQPGSSAVQYKEFTMRAVTVGEGRGLENDSFMAAILHDVQRKLQVLQDAAESSGEKSRAKLFHCRASDILVSSSSLVFSGSGDTEEIWMREPNGKSSQMDQILKTRRPVYQELSLIRYELNVLKRANPSVDVDTLQEIAEEFVREKLRKVDMEEYAFDLRVRNVEERQNLLSRMLTGEWNGAMDEEMQDLDEEEARIANASELAADKKEEERRKAQIDAGIRDENGDLQLDYGGTRVIMKDPFQAYAIRQAMDNLGKHEFVTDLWTLHDQDSFAFHKLNDLLDDFMSLPDKYRTERVTSPDELWEMIRWYDSATGALIPKVKFDVDLLLQGDATMRSICDYFWGVQQADEELMSEVGNGSLHQGDYRLPHGLLNRQYYMRIFDKENGRKWVPLFVYDAVLDLGDSPSFKELEKRLSKTHAALPKEAERIKKNHLRMLESYWTREDLRSRMHEYLWAKPGVLMSCYEKTFTYSGRETPDELSDLRPAWFMPKSEDRPPSFRDPEGGARFALDESEASKFFSSRKGTYACDEIEGWRDSPRVRDSDDIRSPSAIVLPVEMTDNARIGYVKKTVENDRTPAWETVTLTDKARILYVKKSVAHDVINTVRGRRFVPYKDVIRELALFKDKDGTVFPNFERPFHMLPREGEEERQEEEERQREEEEEEERAVELEMRNARMTEDDLEKLRNWVRFDFAESEEMQMVTAKVNDHMQKLKDLEESADGKLTAFEPDEMHYDEWKAHPSSYTYNHEPRIAPLMGMVPSKPSEPPWKKPKRKPKTVRRTYQETAYVPYESTEEMKKENRELYDKWEAWEKKFEELYSDGRGPATDEELLGRMGDPKPELPKGRSLEVKGEIDDVLRGRKGAWNPWEGKWYFPSLKPKWLMEGNERNIEMYRPGLKRREYFNPDDGNSSDALSEDEDWEIDNMLKMGVVDDNDITSGKKPRFGNSVLYRYYRS